MYDFHIYSQLKKYSKANKCFHMPGHKARGDFKAKFPIADLDVTELPYSDNLACPDGVIAAAQKDIAEILGAKKSYILTDGSSSGIFAMAFAAATRGSKIIVTRNCHASVWNACRVLGLEPVIVQGKTERGIILPPDPETLEKLIVNDVNIAGMIITHPDYYGNFAPLDKYKAVTAKHRRLLIVDGAHGAHLAYGSERKNYAGTYADMWVDGAHKTLYSLTQGAIVSVNDEKTIPALEEGLSIFRTTSPSYPVMASVEYGVKTLANDPSLCDKAKEAVAALKANCKELSFYPSDDWAKLAIDFEPAGASSDGVCAALEKKGIYAELSDGRYALFYLSPAVTAKDLNELAAAVVKATAGKKVAKTYSPLPAIPEQARTYSYLYALKRPSELVPLDRAAGRMCAANTGVTPPCIPVVAAGEMFTESAVKILRGAKRTFGISDGKVKVVKK